MHFLLKDGKGLAIINTLFCKDRSKALPEKKKFIASFLRQHGCVCVRNPCFSWGSEELQGAGFSPGGGFKWKNFPEPEKKKKQKTLL